MDEPDIQDLLECGTTITSHVYWVTLNKTETYDPTQVTRETVWRNHPP